MRSRNLTTHYLITLVLLTTSAVVSASHPASSNLDEWWNHPYPTRFDSAPLTKTQRPLKVQGNRIVDDRGRTIVLRGLNISDPDKLVKNGRWSQAHFAAAHAYGANAIRIPIHPIAWQTRGQESYFELLDQAVLWANALDMYLIVDWHSIGNLKTGLFQHPMYNTSLTETRDFWRQVAYRYKDVPTVAVYELFNEPTRGGGQFGDVSWQEWKTINEELIDLIRAQKANGIPLVAGFNWAYDLSEARTAPIERQEIAYAAHPYPTKSKAHGFDKSKDWTHHWGFIAEQAPIIATEIGWMRATDPGAHEPTIDDGTYGPGIVGYLENIGASWTVWCFDPDWPPQVITDWDYNPTEQGRFFREALHRLNNR